MSLRAFVDSGGNEWEVFDVVPRSAERRSRERRALEAAQALAERRESDRRLTVGDVSRLSTVSAGWLCFDRDADRRRLTPIPGDWIRCSDATLEDYCRRARPVRPLSGDALRH